MTIREPFHIRQKRLNGEKIDGFYDEKDRREFFIRLISYLSSSLGNINCEEEVYFLLALEIERESGLLQVDQERIETYTRSDDPYYDLVISAIKYEENIFEFIEILGIILSFIKKFNGAEYIKLSNIINDLFRIYGINFIFVENYEKFISKDSEFIHNELINPALNLLRDHNFEGAEQEFLNSYNLYTKGENKPAIVEAAKSIESTLQTIFDLQNWKYDKKKDRFVDLIKIAFNKGLISDTLENQFNTLKDLIKSGAPKIRNELGAHGQGKKTQIVEDHITAFALHLTASCILYLVRSYQLIE